MMQKSLLAEHVILRYPQKKTFESRFQCVICLNFQRQIPILTYNKVLLVLYVSNLKDRLNFDFGYV